MKRIIILTHFPVSEFYFGQQFYCSAFVLAKYGILLAKNFDWESGIGLIILNPKGKLKKSVNGSDSSRVSKFNVITFNQLGLQYPLWAMNEAVLTIEELSTWPVMLLE